MDTRGPTWTDSVAATGTSKGQQHVDLRPQLPQHVSQLPHSLQEGIMHAQ